MTGALALILASVLTMARSINGEFLFDDPAIWDMGNFQYWSTGSFVIDCRSFFQSPRHLTHLGYRWTFQLFGFRPWAWHAFNLALHTGCTFLIYLIWLPLLEPQRAWLAAMIFAVHPLQVTSACYISGRAALQATFFTLCALVLIQDHHYFLVFLSGVFAWKSKQDGLLYLLLLPAYWLCLR